MTKTELKILDIVTKTTSRMKKKAEVSTRAERQFSSLVIGSNSSVNELFAE